MKQLKFSSLVILFLCLVLGSYLFAWRTSSPALSMSQEDTFTFLPIVVKPQSQQNTIVRLVAPTDGSQVDTLIPVFTFETQTVPNNTAGCLAFSTTPNPTNCMSSFGLPSNWYREKIAWFNLSPNTVYYWRVGAVLNYNYSNIEWSEQWTFVTAPIGGVILPAPILASPADHSLVDPSTLVLQWNSVADALEYSLTVHDKDENRWYGVSGIPGSQTQVGPANLQWIFNMANGTHFEWYVEARNDYAWSANADSWNFNIPSQQSQSNNILFDGTSQLFGHEKNIYVQPWEAE